MQKSKLHAMANGLNAILRNERDIDVTNGVGCCDNGCSLSFTLRINKNIHITYHEPNIPADN